MDVNMEIYRINFSYEVVTRYNATLDIEAEDVANAAEIVQNDYKSGKCILDYNPTEDASIPLEYKDGNFLFCVSKSSKL